MSKSTEAVDTAGTVSGESRQSGGFDNGGG